MPKQERIKKSYSGFYKTCCFRKNEMLSKTTKNIFEGLAHFRKREMLSKTTKNIFEGFAHFHKREMLSKTTKKVFEGLAHFCKNRNPLIKEKNSHKKFKSQKGQSLIETLVLSLVLITLLKFILIIFWLFINLLWMEHQLYQGIICKAQQKNDLLCKQKILQEIKKLNPLGKIKNLKIYQLQNVYKGELIWNFYKKDFLIKQSLILPL